MRPSSLAALMRSPLLTAAASLATTVTMGPADGGLPEATARLQQAIQGMAGRAIIGLTHPKERAQRRPFLHPTTQEYTLYVIAPRRGERR